MSLRPGPLSTTRRQRPSRWGSASSSTGTWTTTATVPPTRARLEPEIRGRFRQDALHVEQQGLGLAEAPDRVGAEIDKLLVGHRQDDRVVGALGRFGGQVEAVFVTGLGGVDPGVGDVHLRA